MAKRNTILVILFIVGLILFDAVQQRYYINTFSLTPEPARLGHLLKSHLIRWAVWATIGVPFGAFVWYRLKRVRLNFRNYTFIFFADVLSVVISVFIISLISIWRQNLELTDAILGEFFVFFTFQKGLAFFMAYGTMAILLNTYFQTLKVKAQEVQIVDLKKTSEELSKGLLSKEEPFLSIKIGNKITPVPLSNIVWIQADDYCVRIHTTDRFYTLRKSLKALEEQLKHYRFIRIHRGALLNLQYVDQINFESSTIRLQNDRELPISRSGIKILKKRIKEASI